MTAAAALLATVLADPRRAAGLEATGWTALLTAARAESLLGTLAARIDAAPPPVDRILAEARAAAEHARRLALWEAEMARRALATAGIVPILLKGTAYAAAGLAAAMGRSIGDLDILVERSRLDAAEAALRSAGWEPVKDDAYDDAYYRRWMHELPPLIHRERDRIVDVHHTILPLTAKPKPHAGSLIRRAREVNGWRVLSPADMIVHAAAHLIADGDLAGGLRNLWDIDQLVRQFNEADDDFTLDAVEEGYLNQLGPQVLRALRLAKLVFDTPVKSYVSPLRFDFEPRASDRLFLRRILARDGWGRATHPVTRFGFYVRSHTLRMPLPMLARHLWVKARRPAYRLRSAGISSSQ